MIVTFRYKDYRRNGQARYCTMTLSAGEFIRRFLLHVLPKGFHRIRHYGLLASAGCKANIARARQLMAAPMAEVDAPAVHEPPRARPIIVRYARAAAAACSLSRSLRAAAHHAARPPAPGSRPDPMIFLPIPWHHPLAGTSRSRRRTSFIPASISAGTAPRTISQSARRIRRQPPVRNHRRLSALSNLKETISRQRRCRAKSP